MASKLFIFCIFAIVLLGLVVAQDYDDGGEAQEGDGESTSDDGGFGGDYSGGEAEESDDAAPADGGEETADTDESAGASQPSLAQLLNTHVQRKKRSLNTDNSQRVLSRVRRGGGGRVGPVYTYQKTDHHGNFKWGVKHNVGKHYGHGK